MLKALEESVGKTIAAVAGEFQYGNECVYFRFTDGTVLGLESSASGEGAYIDLASYEPSDNLQVKLGMISQIECDRRAVEKFKSSQQTKEIHEREEYERLKKKFETQEKTG